MFWRRPTCGLAIILVVLWIAAFHVAAAHAQPQDSSEDDFKAAPGPGERTFASTCAGCHGLDGRGSERAPSIAGSAKVQHFSDAQISSIISNGVPGTGMPPFRSLSAAQVHAVVNYLRILQGKLNARALPGDPKRGEAIFFAKGECSTCHTFSGKGGFFGPDLSTYGVSISAKAILDAILSPARAIQPGYKPAAVTTQDGGRLEGLLRNEDNFSVQLLTKDGSFHFFQKSDVQNVEYLKQSFMPVDYGERLTRSELNDLVSFLMSVRSSQSPPPKSKGQD
jgi:cytochrome c oxidase cbb3-type subunit III